MANNNAKKKILSIFIVLIFFVNLIVLDLGSAESRTVPEWKADIELEIELEQSNVDSSGNYALTEREIKITVSNTGKIPLLALNLTCRINKGSIFYLDENISMFAEYLRIGADYYRTFYWNNLSGGAGGYTITAILTAVYFNNLTEVKPWQKQIQVHLENITNLVTVSSLTLWNKTMPMEPAFDGNYSLFRSDKADIGLYEDYTFEVDISNNGNLMITNSPIYMNATLYDCKFNWPYEKIWDDSKEIYGGIGLVNPKTIKYDSFFDLSYPNFENCKLLNFSVESENISHNSSFWIHHKDIWNVGVTDFTSYNEGGFYTNFTSPVEVILTNTGNWNLTDMTQFSATLTISNDTDTWFEDFDITSENLKNWHAGEKFILQFPMDGITEDFWGETDYTLNVSINPVDEFNNTGTNDNWFEVDVTLGEVTDYDFEIISPLPGIHNIIDSSALDIKAIITNTGNVPIFIGQTIFLNATYENLNDPNDIWINHTNTQVPGPIGIGQTEFVSIGDWDMNFDYNTDFRLIVTLSTVLNGPILASDDVIISLRGGEYTAIFFGSVSGVTHAENVMLTASSVSGPTYFVNTTGTGSTRAFAFTLPAAMNGTLYSIQILETDNYWYEDVNLPGGVTLYCGRDQQLFTPIMLTELPTGYINGIVTLAPMTGGPDLIENIDVSYAVISIDDTPLITSPNETGWYELEVVAEPAIYVLASRVYFITASAIVNVPADDIASANFTLYESWDVTVTPANGEIVTGDTTIIAQFSQEIKTATLDRFNFVLSDSDNEKPLPGLKNSHYLWSNGNRTCTITPPTELAPGNYYIFIGSTQLNPIKTINDESIPRRLWETEFLVVPASGSVSGWVKDNQEMPITDVNVSIGNIFGYTDVNGYYTLENILPGVKTLRVQKKYYSTQEIDVVIISEENIVRNVTLNLIDPPIDNYSPADGALDVAIDTIIKVSFQNPMNTSTIHTSTFLLLSGTHAAVPGTISVSVDNRTYTFIPLEDLEYNTTYICTLKSEIMIDGAIENWYPLDISFTFVTIHDCACILEVIAWHPKGDEVTVDAVVTVTFNDPINISTIDHAFFINGGIAGTKSWNYDNTILTWSHTENLDYNKTYTVILFKNSLKSISGFELEEDFVWSFTTIENDSEEFLEIILGPFLDIDKKPVEGAKVTITINGKEYTGITDALGIATIYIPINDWPNSGRFKVEVSKKGFEDMEYNVTIDDGVLSHDTIPYFKKDQDRQSPDDGTNGGKDSKEANALNWTIILIAIIVVIIITVILAYILIAYKQHSRESDYYSMKEETFTCPECGVMLRAGAASCFECGALFEGSGGKFIGVGYEEAESVFKPDEPALDKPSISEVEETVEE